MPPDCAIVVFQLCHATVCELLLDRLLEHSLRVSVWDGFSDVTSGEVRRALPKPEIE